MEVVISSEGHAFLVSTELAMVLKLSGFRAATESEAEDCMDRAQGSEHSLAYIADVLRPRSTRDPLPNKTRTQPYPIEVAPDGYRWVLVRGDVTGMTPDPDRRVIYGISWNNREWLQKWILVTDDIVTVCQGYGLRANEVVLRGQRIQLGTPWA